VRDLRDGTEHRADGSGGQSWDAVKIQTCIMAAAGDCVVDA
jgi:hypothetical protein